MMETHAGFVAAAYGVAGLALAGLVLRAVLDHRAQVRALARLAAHGATRRSPGSPRSSPP